MANKNIRIADIQRLGQDPLLNSFGTFGFTNEGLAFVEKPTPDYQVFFGQRTVPSSDGSTTQKIVITNPDPDSTEIEDLLRSIEGNQYEYFFANLNTNLTYDEAVAVTSDPVTDLLGVDFEYNFMDEQYETNLGPVTNHNIIPSMYELLQREYIEGDNPDGVAFKENILRGATWQILKKNINQSNSGERTFEELTNQIFTSQNNEFIKRNDGAKNLFPMYCQVNMPYQTNTKIASIIQRSTLGACITRDFYENYISSTRTQPDSILSRNFDYSYDFYDIGGTKSIENARVLARTLDLQSWVDLDSGGWYNGIELSSDSSFIGNETAHADISTEGHAWNVYVGANILENEIENIFSSMRGPTVDQMMAGQSCYTEVVMYKVEKYLGEGLDNKIQTFIFSNTEDLVGEMMGIQNEKRISFVDTQVRYGQTYTYSVSVVIAVIANRYNYSDIEVAQDKSVISANVNITPYIRMVEMPYFQATGRILSNPPLAPELRFTPFKGKTDIIMFSMNTNLGTQDLAPITLDQEEKDVIDQLAVSQRRADGLITFDSDDYNRGYNIYRTAVKPSSYQDFERNLLTTVSTIGDGLESNKEAGSANVIIKQTTNKKYYYMFRAIDFHGLLSNPSEVYEIELYSDGGVGYPIIRKFEFGKEDPKVATKSARKLIQIVPRITQAVLNDRASNIENTDGTFTVTNKTSISLGIEDESLFATTNGFDTVTTGKRFKIRLISKSTGKKVDINIDFNTNRVRSEIE